MIDHMNPFDEIEFLRERLYEAKRVGSRGGGWRFDAEVAIGEIPLTVERLRIAARARGLTDRETFDFGRQVAHSLEVQFSRLLEKRTVEVDWPATWWQHLKWDFANWLLGKRFTLWRVSAYLRVRTGLTALRNSVRKEHRRWDAYLLFDGIEIPPNREPGDTFAVFFERRPR